MSPSARALAVAAVLLAALGACRACPPAWAERVGVEADHVWASASSGEVFVDADATRLALTRAARRLAEHLGLDVERGLSVVRSEDDLLFVEAVGPDGLLDDLDGLELDEVRRCGDRTFVRVRLPRP